MKERTSNIFSPNYSVETVLCTLKCPGSGMAWWANAGAKPHPPHIVLLVDFPHLRVPICRPSALPFPSCLGPLTVGALPLSPLRVRWNSKNMLSQGWCGVSSSAFLNRCCVDYLFQIVVFSLLIQSGRNISQQITNLGSSEVCGAALPLCSPAVGHACCLCVLHQLCT